MPIKFRCPSCRQAYTISSKKAGTKLHCQKCQTKIKVPSASPGEAPKKTARKKTEPEVIDEDDFLADDLISEVSAPAGENSSAEPPPQFEVVDDEADLFREDAKSEPATPPPVPASPSASDSAPPSGEVDFHTAEIEIGGDSTERLPPDQYEPPPIDRLAELAASESRAAEESAGDDADDDLAAVLAFEKSLEDDGDVSTGAAQVPLPDELFDDEDDEDDVGLVGSRAGEDEEMDLTPMVDVTFLLLIFFMITASFSIQKTLQVPPPDPEKEGASTSTTIKEEEEQEQTTVHIDSRNVISVDDEPIPDPNRLVDILRSKGTTDVLITSHENAIHDMLVKVVDAAQEVGMQKIRIGVTKGPE